VLTKYLCTGIANGEGVDLSSLASTGGGDSEAGGEEAAVEAPDLCVLDIYIYTSIWISVYHYTDIEIDVYIDRETYVYI